MAEVKLARASDVGPGALLTYTLVDGKKVALTRAGEQFFAFEDRCSHDDGELSSGKLEPDFQVECPRHGARFDIRNGRATRMPAVAPIATYQVDAAGGEIWLELPEG